MLYFETGLRVWNRRDGLFKRLGRWYTEIVQAEARSEVSSIGDLDIYHFILSVKILKYSH